MGLFLLKSKYFLIRGDLIKNGLESTVVKIRNEGHLEKEEQHDMI